MSYIKRKKKEYNVGALIYHPIHNDVGLIFQMEDNKMSVYFKRIGLKKLVVSY